MIEKLVRTLVIGVVLYIVYIIVGMVVSALGLPMLVTTLVGVILLLAFVVKILQIWGISL